MPGWKTTRLTFVACDKVTTRLIAQAANNGAKRQAHGLHVRPCLFAINGRPC